MKVKKICLIILLCLLSNILLAVSNKQYIIAVNDEDGLIEAITSLYIKSNYALPSMSAPYSVAELELMLQQIDSNKLDTLGRETYNYVRNKLDYYTFEVDEGVAIDMPIDINIETYSHTNTTDYIERDTWVRGWSEQENLLDLNLSVYANSLLYGISDFSFGAARVTEIPFGSSNFQTNIVGLTNLSFETDIETNMPQRAFVLFGGPYWNLQIGRDNIDWGAGLSGNLFISDNLKYQDYFKFTTFGSKYKYTYLASFFPHQLNYVETDGFVLNTSQLDELQGFSMFVAHKMEGRALNNRLGWALSEGLMYASEDSTIDFRAFNPMLSYHSLFEKANCNSILSLDFDFTFSNRTNLYTQIVIDDLVFGLTESTDSSYSPNAYGIILGIKRDFSTDNISLLSTFEVAYTSPYLYLRDKGDTNPSEDIVQEGYGINFIVATREFSNTYSNSGIIWDKQFLGYKFGGDALVINFNNRYGFHKNKIIVETNLFGMIHGTFDIDTPWSTVGGTYDDPGFLSLINFYDTSKTGLSYTGVAGLYSSLEISENIKTFAQFDAIVSYNYDHEGNNSSDFQLTTGFSISF
ncbi:MAG: hypothetical protein PQJ44_04020 [Sphaerochaetaceae bacterium]|nr:hypothetical protein [Sphaerochaetaceae bacterium]